MSSGGNLKGFRVRGLGSSLLALGTRVRSVLVFEEHCVRVFVCSVVFVCSDVFDCILAPALATVSALA